MDSGNEGQGQLHWPNIIENAASTGWCAHLECAWVLEIQTLRSLSLMFSSKNWKTTSESRTSRAVAEDNGGDNLALNSFDKTVSREQHHIYDTLCS